MFLEIEDAANRCRIPDMNEEPETGSTLEEMNFTTKISYQTQNRVSSRMLPRCRGSVMAESRCGQLADGHLAFGNIYPDCKSEPLINMLRLMGAVSINSNHRGFKYHSISCKSILSVSSRVRAFVYFYCGKN